MNFSSDAMADFEGLLEVNRKICQQQMAEKASPTLPTNCAVLPKNNSARSQAQIKRREHEKSSVRAKVEHVFAVLKLQLRYRKTRYRGLQKQTAKVNILLALANLILADRPGLTA